MTKTNELEKEISQILENSKEEIKNATMDQVKEALKRNIAWNLEHEIKTVVADFFKTEMEGEIKKTLLDQKDLILEELKKGVVASCAILAKEMVIKAETNIKSSYTMSEITKKLFN